MNSLQKDKPMTPPEDDWRESLSALVDGECQTDELDALLRGQVSPRQAQDTSWACYQIVGAALRGSLDGSEQPPSAAFASAVMGRLAAGQRPAAATAPDRQQQRSPAVNDPVWRWRWAGGLAAVVAAVLLGWQWQGGAAIATPELARSDARQGAEGGSPAHQAGAGLVNATYESARR